MRRVRKMLMSLFRHAPPSSVSPLEVEKLEMQTKEDELRERAHVVARRVNTLEWQLIPPEASGHSKEES